MQANHTNEVKFESAEVEKLISLLNDLEAADDPEDAVWYDEKSRNEVQLIREHVERATGRSNQ
jgi:hypothetical protein